MKHIIVISAKIGSGKNEVAEYIQSKYTSQKFNQLAIGKYPKSLLPLFANCTYEDTLTREGKAKFLDNFNCTVEQLIVKVAENMKEINPRIWVNPACDEMFSNTENYIISDWRFLEEIKCIEERMKNINDCKLTKIRINRKNNNVFTTRDKNHKGEVELDEYESYDYIIDNDSTLEDLYQKVDEIVENIIMISY